MAITLVAKADHHITGAGPLVLPALSWQAGDVIAVSTMHIAGAPETITPTVAGLTFVPIGQAGPDGSGWWSGRVGALHYAIATAAGSGTISVAASAAGYPWIDSAYVLRGVDTTNPLRTAFLRSDAWDSANGLITLATEPGDMVIGAYGYNTASAAATPTGGQTVDRVANDGSAWGLTYHRLADGTSVASTWDRGGVEAQWRHVAVAFRAAQMGPAPTLTITSGPTIADDAGGQKVTAGGAVNFQGDAGGTMSATVVSEPAGTVLGPWPVTINQARDAWTFERVLEGNIGAGSWRIKPTISANGQTATATSGTFEVDEIGGDSSLPDPTTAPPVALNVTFAVKPSAAGVTGVRGTVFADAGNGRLGAKLFDFGYTGATVPATAAFASTLNGQGRAVLTLPVPAGVTVAAGPVKGYLETDSLSTSVITGTVA